MMRLLTLLFLGAMITDGSAQSPAGRWIGRLTQDGQPDTFSYEMTLLVNGKAVSGTACSYTSDRSAHACFALSGVWDQQQLTLQEVSQTGPDAPRWCLKFINLRFSSEAAAEVLAGEWKAQGCRPGRMILRRPGSSPGAGALAVEEVPFSFPGRWTGHLSQSDRDYGFFFEIQLHEDGSGTSHIVSEGNGGEATHVLSWSRDEENDLILLAEEKILEKTDPRWRWCIKSARLRLRRDAGQYLLEGNWEGFIEGHTPKSGPCAPGTVLLEKPVLTQVVTREIEKTSLPYEAESHRKVKIDRSLEVRSNTIRLKVWDNGTVDGDVVTLFLNGNRVLHNYRVSKHKWSIPVQLTEKHNLLILHAEDLGDISPNTVAVSIDDGFREEVIILSSNLNESGAILIKPFTVE